jgi:hypothetical protein
MKNYKVIPIEQCKLGMSFQGIHYPNGRSSWGPTYKIINIEKNGIVCIDSWHQSTYLFQFNQGIKIEIPMTQEEIKIRDFDKAKEIAQNLKHEMYNCGDAYHEMWNGWIGTDPYELAQNAKEYNLIILGYFKLEQPKITYAGTILDIGVVVEDEDGDRFWCHAKKVWFDDWEEKYPELYLNEE